MNTRQTECPDRNLAMELVRVTEAAALASGRWVGRGMKNEGDGAAVDAMRKLINSVNMRGVVVIGEGEKDEAPMLFNGEEVGTGQGADVDIAVDPIDGTTLMAEGRPNAISVLAAAERGTMYDPSAVFYMKKIAVGPEAAGVIMMGIGGTPEGIITACAMKCMGGEIQGKLYPTNDEEIRKAQDAGLDLDTVLTTNDLVSSDNCYFVATGVTNGDMLRGVSYRQNGATTRSLVMRSRSGTVRFIESVHQLAKLQEYSAVDYSPKN